MNLIVSIFSGEDQQFMMAQYLIANINIEINQRHKSSKG